jgi:glycosyltransferase involved in cell wall biosynthesis
VRELGAALIAVSAETGHRIHIFADTPEIAAEFAPDASAASLVRPGLLGRFAWDHWKAPIACARAGVDVVVNPRSFRSLFVARRSLSIVYDMSYHDIPAQLPWWDGAYFRALHQLSLARSDLIAVFSGFTRERILANLPKVPSERIVVLPPGPPGVEYQPLDEAAVLAARAKFEISGRYVIAVGAQPRKNIDTILDALAALGAEGDPVGLVVVSAWSDAAHVQSLRERAQRLGLGPRFQVLRSASKQDLAALYGGATAHVYVSSYEGIGIPPFEAMATGCPVIASEAASLPEVVGDAAEWVRERDVAALATAIRRLRDEPGRASLLRQRGFARVRGFDWKRTARALLAAVDTHLAV